jgi:hypothetical protein
MLVQGFDQQLVRLNQRFHRVIVWTRILCNHVRLNASACRLTSISEFADKIVLEEF